MARTKQRARKSTGNPPRNVCTLYLIPLDEYLKGSTKLTLDDQEDYIIMNSIYLGRRSNFKFNDEALIEKKEGIESVSGFCIYTSLNQKDLMQNLEFINYYEKCVGKFYNNLLNHYFYREFVEITIFEGNVWNVISEMVVFETLFQFLDPLSSVNLAMTCKSCYERIFIEERFRFPSLILFSKKVNYPWKDYIDEEEEEGDFESFESDPKQPKLL